MEKLRGTEAAPLARRLQRAMCSPDIPGEARVGKGEELTKRELSILKRLETGLSNKEIAEAIFVSEGTLKWHLHNVYGKLNVRNRTVQWLERGRSVFYELMQRQSRRTQCPPDFPESLRWVAFPIHSNVRSRSIQRDP